MTVAMGRDLFALQDDCLIAIESGRQLKAHVLQRIPPWRAVLLARIADRAGTGIEYGTLEQLIDEAKRVHGDGELVWPPR